MFRKDNDQGKCRQECNPDPNIIRKNLDRFVLKWQNLGESLSNATHDEIHKLQSHIAKGCLSGIRPHEGTEQNEGLHRILNNALSSTSRVIGPELAFALITMIFYIFNMRHNSSAIRRAIGYVDVEFLFSDNKEKRSQSSFGFLHQHYRKNNLQIANTDESGRSEQSQVGTAYLTNENAALIISEMLSVHEIYSNVSFQCERKGTNVFD